MDDYFARCRLVAFDHRAAGIVNRQESEYQTIATKEMTLAGDEVAGFPLALSLEEWTALGARFAAFDAWQAVKAGADAETSARSSTPTAGPSTPAPRSTCRSAVH